MARALNEGVYAAGRAQQTLSPSMDIQVASNFERALFEASGRDANWVRDAMTAFARNRQISLPAPIRAALAERYSAYRADDAETLAVIGRVHAGTGRLIDPHTAVAMAAAERVKEGARGPVVVLSTAHPGKFPDAVQRATGQIPALPPRLSGLLDRSEKMTVLAPELGLVRAHIAARVPVP
jgi:threonine synthase